MDFDDLDDNASAMAAAMGFSSFGSHKPPAKKRKFNATTDAFVEGQELEKVDRGGKKGTGSGGNTMPLGKIRQFGTEKKSALPNEATNDEINLDDEDEEDGGVPIERIDPPDPAGAARLVAQRQKLNLPTPTAVPDEDYEVVNGDGQNRKGIAGDGDENPLDNRRPGSTDKQGLPIRKAVVNGGNEDEIDVGDEYEEAGPAYLDTSEAPPIEVAPPPDLDALEMQARIDALLASIEAEPRQAIPEEYNPLAPLMDSPHQPDFIHPGFNQSQGSSRGGSRGGRGRGGFSDAASVASSRPSHIGERNPLWYMEYYDPGFNENPWEKLEAERNMQSVGSWLETKDRHRRERW
ncbi:uncharacterized protein PAC_08013 [Phialocephala subalpina]|uniref:Uncharacterized protein n=1 Tax=Phialocephala subalpina TaxID=576137 RepID=A0A1L7WZC0_9HELO|nr:uncharacterized protein PAC_08013 [Phialocephala subalpina]